MSLKLFISYFYIEEKLTFTPKYPGWGFKNFILRQFLLNPVNGLLPNGQLIINCEIGVFTVIYYKCINVVCVILKSNQKFRKSEAFLRVKRHKCPLSLQINSFWT